MMFSEGNIVSCKDYYVKRKKELTRQIAELEKIPTLVVIQIDDDKASNSYIKGKKKDCEEIGIDFVHFKLDSKKYSQEDLCNTLIAFSKDELVHGIIIQLPIPNKYDFDKLINCITPEKDVDGFRKDSLFKPCTPGESWIGWNIIIIILLVKTLLY